MHFSLGSYSHKRAQPSCRQLSAADGELDELFLQQPSLICSISCTRAVQLTSTDLEKTVVPKPVALHHLGSHTSILGRPPCFPDPLSSQTNWQGFTPAHPACKQLHGRSMRLWAQHPAEPQKREAHLQIKLQASQVLLAWVKNSNNLFLLCNSFPRKHEFYLYGPP